MMLFVEFNAINTKATVVLNVKGSAVILKDGNRAKSPSHG